MCSGRNPSFPLVRIVAVQQLSVIDSSRSLSTAIPVPEVARPGNTGIMCKMDVLCGSIWCTQVIDAFCWCSTETEFVYAGSYTVIYTR